MSSNSYTRRINLFINGKEVTGDIASIKNEMRKLVNEQARMTIGSREYNQHMQKIKGLKGILQEHNEQLKVTKNSWLSMSGMADKFNTYFGMATAFIATATGLVFGARKIIQSNAELSDSFANVSKTTDLTTTEVKSLYKELKKIDTRTANRELLDLATIAGKLGVKGKENVLGFVRAADQINVALSEDLGGNAEESIRQVGKLVDIFKIKDTYGLEQAMLKVGSAINALGAASTANEGYMVEFTKRVAGIAPSAGISLDKILGLAATLDQLGQTSEVSSTVFAQVVPLMFKETATFAQIANMSVEDFTSLLKKDTNEAFITFLEGLNGNNEGLATMVNKMDDIGLEGKRSIAVLGVLANNTKLLREQQKFANSEFEKGTSLTLEFDKKNTNLAATIDKLRKRFANMFISSNIVNGLKNFVSWIERATRVSIKKNIEEERRSVYLLVQELTNANTSEETRKKILDKLSTVSSTIVKNLKAEKIELGQLSKNLRAYNEEVTNKIILGNLEEEEEKQLTKLAKVRVNLANEQTDAIMLMNQAYRIAGKHNKELYEQESSIILSQDDLNTKLKKFADLLEKGEGIKPFSDALEKILKLEEKLNTEEAKSEGYSQRIIQLKEILGLNQEIVTIDSENTTDQDGDQGDDDNSSIKKRKELYDKYQEIYEAYKRSRLENEEREIAEVKAKYAKLIEEAKGYEDIKQKLAMQRDLEIKDLELERDERLKKEKEEKEKKYLERVQQLKEEYGLLSDEQLMQEELNQLTELHDMKLLSEEEFLQLKEKLEEKYRKSKKEKDAEAIKKEREAQIDKLSVIKARTEEFSDFINSLQDLQLKEVERRVAKGVITEEQGEKQKKEILKKYADLQFIVQLANIGSNTAVAVMKALADLGPIAGGIAATFIGGTGLLQAGIANKERQKVKQLAKGKYNVIGADDGRFYPNVPFKGPVMGTGIIHGATLISESGDEIILNGAHVRNLQANYPEILRAIYATRVPQRAEGSYNMTSYNTVTSQADIKKNNELLYAVLGMLTKLNNEGVNLNMDQKKTYKLRKALEKQQEIESAASR